MADKLHIFEVHATFEEQVMRRDEFGWAPGGAPSEAPWKRVDKPEVFRVVCVRESQARESAAEWFRPVRNVEIVKVERVKLDAVVINLQG